MRNLKISGDGRLLLHLKGGNVVYKALKTLFQQVTANA